MNYLAHLYLAKESDELIVGNFIGDFVKGKLRDQYPAPILNGIILHRKIDAFTDAHRIVRQCRRLISIRRRRYAGIILDVLFDHFLTINWNSYSVESLDGFIARVFLSLKKYENIMPHDALRLLPAIKERDWLKKYRDIDDLSRVFVGLSARISKKNPLAGSEDELIINYRELEKNFDIFFPELISFSESVKKELNV